jgi:hypothetical protein
MSFRGATLTVTMEVEMRCTHYQRGLAIVTRMEIERSFEEWFPCHNNGYVRPLTAEEMPPEVNPDELLYGYFDAEGEHRGTAENLRHLVTLAEEQGFTTHPLH